MPMTKTVEVESQDAIRALVFSLAFPVTGPEGPITWSILTGTLPAGLALVSDTITGTPVNFCARREIVVQADDGITQVTWTFDLGVTVRAGYEAVTDELGIDPFPHWWPGLIPAYDTDVAIEAGFNANSDRTALINAITAAAADQGTSGSPKFHRIIYRGRHLDTATNGNTPIIINGGNEHTYIHVVGDHPVDSHVRVSDLRWPGRPVIENFMVHGMGRRGFYDDTTTVNAIDDGGATKTYHWINCRFGGWWIREFVNTVGNNLVYRYHSNAKAIYERCEFASLKRAVSLQGARVAMIDCLCHNVQEDLVVAFTDDLGDVMIYVAGGITTRYIQKVESDPSFDTDHVDNIQTDSNSLLNADKFVIQLEKVIFNADATLYGSTGLRLGFDNGGLTSMPLVSVKDAILMTTGVHSFISEAVHCRVDGLCVAPAPGAASLQHVFQPTSQSRIVTGDFNNISRSSFTDKGALTVTGHELTVTPSSESSVNTAWPNLPGQMQFRKYLYSGSNVTRFVPDFWNIVHHPDAIRAKASECFMRGANWADSANLLGSDPTTWGIHDWGTVPAPAAPTVTLPYVTMSDTAISASVHVSRGGRTWWLVATTDAKPPNQLQLRHRSLGDGTSPSKFGGAAGALAETPTHGVELIEDDGYVPLNISFAALPASGSLWIYVQHEGFDGKISAVQQIGPFSDGTTIGVAPPEPVVPPTLPTSLTMRVTV